MNDATLLYRGSDKDPLQPSDFPLWLCEDYENAKRYGKRVCNYKCTKQLRLLNLQHKAFQDDFVSRVNFAHLGNLKMGMNIEKLKILAAIGLPNYDTQVRVLGKVPINIELKSTIDLYIGCVGNIHRYSTTEYDKLLVDALKNLYGTEYDGYISKIGWPSYFHDGFLTPEVCIFNPSLCLKEGTEAKSGGKKRKQTMIGGMNIESLIRLPRQDFIPTNAKPIEEVDPEKIARIAIRSG